MNIELVVYETQRNRTGRSACSPSCRPARINGIICVANLSNLNSEYRRLLEEGFPIVFLMNPNDPRTRLRDDLNIVTSDSEGPFYATKYLLDLGHKNIMYLGDPKIPRFRGYKKAIKSTGKPLNQDLIVDCEDNFEAAYKYLKENFEKGKFSAILAISDEIGMGCWFALTELGVRIPEDCSIIGYNNKYSARLSLTAIAEPLIEQGKNALYLLHECMSNYQVKPRSIVLKEGLIVRDSCSKV